MSLHSLPLFHRIAGSRVIVAGDGAMADAKRRLIERAGATCCSEDAEDAYLAFVALAEPGEAEAAASRLKARGLLVNVADRPDLCDFTLPSVLERGDVLVAVSTGGASAGLAKHLRLRLETLLPQSLALLANRLATAREAMRSRWPDAGSRRHALDEALSDGGSLDPLDPDAASRIDDWLTGATDPTAIRVVDLELNSPDPDDLTLRQARLLGRADAVVHDEDVPEAILVRARADAIRLSPTALHSAPAGLVVVLKLRGGTSR